MSNQFGFIDIILLAMFTGFIILRLRNILGRKTGHQGKPMNKYFPKGMEVLKDIENNEAIKSGKVDEKTKENYSIVNHKKNILLSDGINLIDIMGSEYVDPYHTFSNDIIEIYDIFGIEAGRNILIDEIVDVIEHAGEYINLRHIELLCDTMTSKGELTSINRQGINRGDVGPLAKCSFEDTTDQLIKAGIFSEKDNLSGVSSNIMMGQKIKSGTGLCNIYIDEDKLYSSILDTEDIYEDEGDINNLLSIQEEGDCIDNDFKFSFE